MASKTTLAKEKTRKKREFYAKVQKVVLDISTEKMMELGVKTDLKISYRSGNRYISFSQYGKKMSVLLYTKGQIVLQVSEFCHEEYEKQIFEISEDEKEQEAFVEYLRGMFSLLLNEFLDEGVLGFHGYMDYLVHFGDVEIAYNKMMAQYPNEEDD